MTLREQQKINFHDPRLELKAGDAGVTRFHPNRARFDLIASKKSPAGFSGSTTR
jgi:hypothetical protein